ncbi:hypothetical protein BC937DRAFT_89834 [Endogone sp. FLAS-F59071]|nr:hypothetical protein BC937DRAFT_89834 [Endogone sp. FLAS-F59071]|eukprot:RUS17540.1 hypothetical protein BC937DRAFT_89834 [Endogone sp. FLAS-F59071]
MSHFSPKRNFTTMDRSGSPHSHKKQRRKVVFVDPDDPTAPYWWPAMVVPADEIAIFKQTMDTNVRDDILPPPVILSFTERAA